MKKDLLYALFHKYLLAAKTESNLPSPRTHPIPFDIPITSGAHVLWLPGAQGQHSINFEE